MKKPGLLSAVTLRDRRELPGLTGVARVDRNTDALLRRVGAHEIAVLDQIDLDRPTADALLAAGVTLVDGVGDDVLRRLRDGTRIRLHDGGVFLGEHLVGQGAAQNTETVAAAMDGAKQGLSNQ